MEAPLHFALRAFAEAHLGPLSTVTALGTAGAAWRLEAARGVAYLKAHRQPGKHRRERDAYLALAPGLPAPTLLAVSEDPPALLLSALPGVDASPLPGAQAQRLALFEAAGRALEILHRHPVSDPDPIPLDVAYQRRREATLRRAAGVLAPEVLTRVAERTAGLPAALQGGLRVPCHRDYEPRNWRWSPFGILDFEHARPDVWLADLTRLELWGWPTQPDLREAFFDGYGRSPSPEEQDVLRMLLALDAAQTWAWGLSHRDPEFTARGELAWARLDA